MVKKILSKQQISALARRVVAEAKKDDVPISRVFVFGSYAKDRATENSDLDLCFISNKFKDTIEAEAYLRTKIFFLFDSPTPIDVVAYRPEQLRMNIPLAAEIRKTGLKVV